MSLQHFTANCRQMDYQRLHYRMQLYEEWATALEAENKAKNVETDLLYKEIAQLKKRSLRFPCDSAVQTQKDPLPAQLQDEISKRKELEKRAFFLERELAQMGHILNRNGELVELVTDLEARIRSYQQVLSQCSSPKNSSSDVTSKLSERNFLSPRLSVCSNTSSKCDSGLALISEAKNQGYYSPEMVEPSRHRRSFNKSYKENTKIMQLAKKTACNKNHCSAAKYVSVVRLK